MRVTLLKRSPEVYSCNSYHIRGGFNAMEDVNTVIDPGTDGYILDEISSLSTGVGKSRIEQVIITHEHFDHAGGLKYVLKEFKPVVLAHTMLPGVTHITRHGMKIMLGDREATILHTPGHSNDSICVWVEEEKTLFSGDTAINIRTRAGSYGADYVEALEMLCSLGVEKIYSGHDDPVLKNGHAILEKTLENVKQSRIIY